jgi:imidazolonepropionase-like amidohydrolase
MQVVLVIYREIITLFNNNFLKHFIMKKIFSLIILCGFALKSIAQENVYPAPAQSGSIALTNATIHIGNTQIIEKGTVVFDGGKIIYVGSSYAGTAATTVNCEGKHIYPGLITPSSTLGLIEVASVRSTRDNEEIGLQNSSTRSITAYNTDSKIINTLRSNGILMASITPEGQVISGTSSVVQLDAWTWQDAAYAMDNGLHINWPILTNFPRFGGGGGQRSQDNLTEGLKNINELKEFFTQAKNYLAAPAPKETNLKYENIKGLFNKTQTLYIHTNFSKEILAAIEFAKSFDFKMVVVGGMDSWLVAQQLKDNNIPVILYKNHELPVLDDDDVDQPYKTATALQQAGVLFSICHEDGDGFWRQRNLPFYAGTMAAYGMSKEQALQSITLNAAKILGIENKTGSIEVGKDANIVVSEGDILDMKSSKVTHAFIQGRKIDLTNKQTQLFDKYKYRYNIK